ncbi:MAG: hypothetical protein HYZ25_19505 [Chloroflexi bacterium]|nr:hypothetical protein [Chloroflexota bacterium]
MKFLANLLVVFSLLLGQFNLPLTRPVSANINAAPAGDIATPTPTVPPTETPTPIVTETIPPAPISTEVPTEEVTPPPAEPQITINMYSTPGFVTPGEPITVNWSIQGISASEHKLYLSIVLPEGFTLKDSNLDYNGTTRTLTLPVLQESGQFDLQAEQPAEDALMLASLMESNTSLAQFSLPLPTHEQFTVDETGGEVVADDGNVTITFPENVLPEETTISVGLPGGEDAPVQSLSGHPIEITATTNSDDTKLHRFDQPITISMQYEGLNIPKERLNDLYVYWYNPEAKGWEALVSSIDPETQTISTETTHFSVFDIGINDWQATHLPTVDGFQVSQFTGAGSFSLPIDLPVGPGGLKPSLTLSYNSQVIDQARIDTQASWVGMGWSLDAPAIERDTHGTSSDTGDDTFMLSVAGVSTRLVDMGYGGYQAQDKNFWRIERNSVADTWTVWDKTGNIYYFGDVAEENVNSTSHMLYRSSDMHELIRQTYRWALRRQQNIFGKSILYTYTKETKSLSVINVNGATVTDTADTAIYPEYIIYPNNHYRIWFEKEARWDYYDGWKTDQAYHSFQMQRLKSLHIQNYASGAWTTVSKYNFGYAPNNSTEIIFPGVSAWHPIEQQLGKVTTLVSFGQEGLPGYTFNYADKLHLTYATNGYGGSVQFDYDSDPNQVLYQPWYYDTNARLTYTAEFKFGPSGEMGLCLNASGNQGGWTALSGTVNCTTGGYLSVQGTGYNPTTLVSIRPGGYYKLTMTAGGNSPSVGLYNGSTVTSGNGTSAFILLPATASVAAPIIQSTTGGTVYVSDYKMQLLPTFYRVYRKTISDGTNSYTYAYSYSGAAVNDTAHSLMAQACYPNQVDCNEYNEELSEFRGHAQVTETSPDGRQIKTTFWQDDARKGMPISVETRDLANVLMNSTLYTYGVTSADIGFWSYYHIQGFKQYWVYTDTEEHRTYNNDGVTYSYTLTDNTYETTYGNLTSTTESGSTGLFRTITTEYVPNSGTPYLVGLPARQTVTNAGGALIAETWSLYDGHTSYSSQPDNGKLTGQRTLIRCINNDCTSTNNRRYSDIKYAYDSWGNRTTVSAYKDEGLWASPFIGLPQSTYTCYGELDPTNGCGDSQNTEQYYTYPSWIRNTKGQTTYITYDYAMGVPLTETDPNGATTRAEYDEFGRITDIFLPDKDSGLPPSNPNYSIHMEYYDTIPFTTLITQHVDDLSHPYYTIKRVYDGMGRQVQSISFEGGYFTHPLPLTAVSMETEYPSASTTQQSAPHLIGDPAEYTVTTSNINARTSTVTAPDGTSTVTATNGLTSTVTDPRGNVTTSVKDVWGRTLSVTPPTGPAVTYTYDEQGNMLTASRGGVTTYLTYNQAGQKIAMTDPDMGGWTYDYDALGNITSQTDARGCTLTMTYDALNRMTGKSSSGACGTQVSATYTYDTGTNGI